MITIPIYIFDESKKSLTQIQLDENERLGYEKNKIDPKDLGVKMRLTDFFFAEKDFTGFWVDPDIHDDSKSKDIIFYIGTCCFRTPYTKEKILEFIRILDQK
jgi:hypothetical protein